MPCVNFVIIALLLGVSGRAAADGLMFSLDQPGRAGVASQSAKQEALMVVGPEDVRVMLRTQFKAGPQELAWFIPVPSQPLDVQVGNDQLFDALDSLTAPTFFRISRPATGVSCGHAAEPAQTEPLGVGLTVDNLGKAGIFDIAVLSATSTETLIQWLRDHRARIPDDAVAALQPYVQRRWFWLVLRVRPDANTQEILAPQPITFRYASRSPVFPLIVSSPFASELNEVVVYVLSDVRYTAENWENRDLPASGIEYDATSPNGTSYARWFRTVTAKHVFVTEFARRLASDDEPAGALAEFAAPIEGERKLRYLTRLRSIVPRANLDRDVQLVSSVGAEVVPRIVVNDPRAGRSAVPLLAAVAIIGGGRLRRKLKLAGYALILVGLLGLTI